MYNNGVAGVAGAGALGGVGAGSLAAGGSLPVTGLAVGGLLVLAFALMLLGFVLVRTAAMGRPLTPPAP
jgi:hypothetical protein